MTKVFDSTRDVDRRLCDVAGGGGIDTYFELAIFRCSSYFNTFNNKQPQRVTKKKEADQTEKDERRVPLPWFRLRQSLHD